MAGQGLVCSPGLVLPELVLPAEGGDKDCLSAVKAGDCWLWGSRVCRGPLCSASDWLKYVPGRGAVLGMQCPQRTTLLLEGYHLYKAYSALF